MRPQQTVMFKRPLTPLADSSDSSFPQSSKSDQSTTTDQSRFSHSRFPSQRARFQASVPSKASRSTFIDQRQSQVVQSLEDKLRKHQKGDTSINATCLIGAPDFRKLERTIDRLPATDPLKGHWDDKLHYKYDSDTEIFQISMPTEIHERLGVSIREQVNDWLKELRKHKSVCIREYALAVVEQASTRIEYSSDKVLEPASIEEAVGPASPSEPRSDSSFSEDMSLRPAAINRSYRIRSDDANTRQGHAPANQVHQEEPAVYIAHSDTKEKRYDPDNSWRFMSPQIEDQLPAFVLEIAKTQREDELHNKIEGLLGPCEASAVLTCRTDMPDSKRACIELWQSSHESQNVAQRVWSLDILNDQGAVPDHFPWVPIRLANFATEDSASSFLDQYSDEEVRPWFDDGFLVLDFAKLGCELVKLRDHESKRKMDMKRKRSRDAAEGKVVRYEDESDRRQALRQKLRAL